MRKPREGQGQRKMFSETEHDWYGLGQGQNGKWLSETLTCLETGYRPIPVGVRQSLRTPTIKAMSPPSAPVTINERLEN